MSCVIIQYDSLEEDELLKNRIESHGVEGFDPAAWRQARSAALHRVQDVLTRHFYKEERSERIPLLILDDTFHYRSMRYEVYRMCREVMMKYNRTATKSVGFATLYVSAAAETCKARNQQRFGRRRVPDSSLMEMMTKFEPPCTGGGWDGVYETLSNNDSEVYFPDKHDATLKSVVSRALENPVKLVQMPDVKASEDDRARTSRNVAHAVDKLLRFYVGKVCQNRSEESMTGLDIEHKVLAQAANGARRNILEGLRRQMKMNGDILLEEVIEGELRVQFVGLLLENLVVRKEEWDVNAQTNTKKIISGMLDGSEF
mmetsp:Transcript_21552/g.48979  ORF Transcript_21552/g.48979 Transcript_21552/m.48979 type:complete len:315 (-) Transcript_21552:286-1230(-)